MKRLFILRHAKAEPEEPGAGDAARPLAQRGREDATRLGAWLAAGGHCPDLILCSTATRTVQTWEGIVPAWPSPPETRFLQALYLAPAPAIAGQLKATPAKAASLMVIGHNPGLENLAMALARKPGKTREGLPTAGLVILDFAMSDWSKLAPGAGELIELRHPR